MTETTVATEGSHWHTSNRGISYFIALYLVLFLVVTILSVRSCESCVMLWGTAFYSLVKYHLHTCLLPAASFYYYFIEISSWSTQAAILFTGSRLGHFGGHCGWHYIALRGRRIGLRGCGGRFVEFFPHRLFYHPFATRHFQWYVEY